MLDQILNFISEYSKAFIIFGVIVGLSIIGSFLEKSDSEKPDIKNSKDIKDIKADILEIKNELSNNKLEHSDEEKQKILKIVTEKMQQQTAKDYLEQLKQELQENIKQDERNYSFDRVLYRLEHQVKSLKGRGRANLLIGMLIAIAGVYFLGSAVLQVSSEQNNDALMTQFVPKVTLTILTEIFAFFFLRLYSNGLVEVKYWQNELTNLELKHIAYNGAMKELESKDLQIKIIEGLFATERNFVLNKNQTTVELEKEKLHRQDISDLAAIIKNNNKAK